MTTGEKVSAQGSASTCQAIRVARQIYQQPKKLPEKLLIFHHWGCFTLHTPQEFRHYFSPQLLTIYKSQIRPSLEYYSHVWGGTPKSSLHLLDRVQSKAIRLINNANLTNSLQSLTHRRLVADPSIFYRYFHGQCSQEIKNIIPDPVRRV